MAGKRVVVKSGSGVRIPLTPQINTLINNGLINVFFA